MNPYLSNISGECVVDFQRAKQLLGVKENLFYVNIDRRHKQRHNIDT